MSGFVKAWRAAGVDAIVLTGIPNHPEGVVPDAYKNRPAFHREEIDGVPVWRHWLYVTANKGKFKRVFNMLSFAGSVLWQNLGSTDAKPDIVMASSPSFFSVISAWILARRYGAKFVFEVRDLWPAIFVQMGILRKGLIYWLLERMEMFLYRRADAVVTVTRSFARNIAKRGIKREKLWVVFNGVSKGDFAAAAEARASGANQRLRSQLGVGSLNKVVLYIGNHGEAQGLGQIIDAARMLVKRTDITFMFVGSGADRERLVQYAKGVPNIQFLPAVNHKDVWAYYAMADINMVCLKNIPDFDMFIPSKMFEIMAAESCAVAALRGEGAEIMQESGCALVVPSGEADKIADAISILVDDPVRRVDMAGAGRAFVAKHFLHNDLADRYLGLFKHLLGGQAERIPERG